MRSATVFCVVSVLRAISFYETKKKAFVFSKSKVALMKRLSKLKLENRTAFINLPLSLL